MLKAYSDERSKELCEKARKTLVKEITNSFRKAHEEFPIYFEYGKESKICDADNSKR